MAGCGSTHLSTTADPGDGRFERAVATSATNGLGSLARLPHERHQRFLPLSHHSLSVPLLANLGIHLPAQLRGLPRLRDGALRVVWAE